MKTRAWAECENDSRTAVDKVLLADLHEVAQVGLILGGNTTSVHAAFEVFKDGVTAEQFYEASRVPIVGIELPHGRGEFESEFRCVKNRAVKDDHLHAAESLAAELASLFRREPRRHEADARDVTRIEIPGEFARLDPRSTKDLERRVGAAAHRNICILYDADASIKRRFVHVAHVGREIDPDEAGRVKPVSALPTLDGNYGEFGVDAALAVEHSCQLTHRHAVSNRFGRVVDETEMIAVRNWTLYVDAGQGIGPVEYHN